MILLYVLRDVFCGIQKWRFENALVKLKMCKSILVVIAKTMKIYNEAQVRLSFTLRNISVL